MSSDRELEVEQAKRAGIREGLQRAISLADEKYMEVDTDVKNTQYAQGMERGYSDMHDCLLDLLAEAI